MRWHDQRWFYDFQTGDILHMRGGDYDTQSSLPPEALDIRIGHRDDLSGLVKVLEERGYVVPRLDDRLRAEDLKITHRLLDLLEKGPA